MGKWMSIDEVRDELIPPKAIRACDDRSASAYRHGIRSLLYHIERLNEELADHRDKPGHEVISRLHAEKMQLLKQSNIDYDKVQKAEREREEAREAGTMSRILAEDIVECKKDYGYLAKCARQLLQLPESSG